MLINCRRCETPIDTPDSTNSDYIISDEFMEEINDEMGERTEMIPSIICPICYNAGTDTVIWGIHKV